MLWISMIFSLNIRDKRFAIFDCIYYNWDVLRKDAVHPVLFFGGMPMIRHLNPMTFQAFGSILPERPDSAQAAGKGEHVRQLELRHGPLPLYRTVSETWLCGRGAMTVLAIQQDEAFFHFYLDKPVLLRPGVVFCLVPLAQETAAEIAYQRAPEVVGHSTRRESLQIPRKLRVESLYTFFYQEKEQGFIFSGEAHPMPELTYVDQGSLHSVADGQDVLLEQGDIVVYMPDQWHMQYADMGVAPRFVTISFGLEGQVLERLRDRKIKAPQQAVTLLQQMLREQENPDEFSSDAIITMLGQLLVILLRQDEQTKAKVRSSNGVHSENEIIRRCQQYVSENLWSKLTVPALAEAVGVSASYLTALFHKNLQISPGEYVRRIKLQ